MGVFERKFRGYALSWGPELHPLSLSFSFQTIQRRCYINRFMVIVFRGYRGEPPSGLVLLNGCSVE